MAVNVEIKGTEELCRILEKLPQEIQDRVDEGLGEGAKAVAEKAQEIVPVRTGYLKSTIAASRTTLFKWKVQATADYARLVEYGTSRTAPRPFLSTSLMLMGNYVVSLVKKSLAEAIEKVRS